MSTIRPIDDPRYVQCRKSTYWTRMCAEFLFWISVKLGPFESNRYINFIGNWAFYKWLLIATQTGQLKLMIDYSPDAELRVG